MTDQTNIASLKRKKRLLARYGSSCPYCLRPLNIDNLSIDHVIPRMAYNHRHKHPLKEIATRFKEWLRNKELTGAERIYTCKKCNKNRGIQSLIQFLKSEYIAKHFNRGLTT